LTGGEGCERHVREGVGTGRVGGAGVGAGRGAGVVRRRGLGGARE